MAYVQLDESTEHRTTTVCWKSSGRYNVACGGHGYEWPVRT